MLHSATPYEHLIMAHSVWGTGTMYYGMRDFRPDCSYITTEWVSVLFLPIVPLRSFRVASQERTSSGFGWRSSYLVFEKTRPNGKQVIGTYCYVCLMIAWVISTGTILGKYINTGEALPVCSAIALWILPAPTPWVLRYLKLRKLPKTTRDRIF